MLLRESLGKNNKKKVQLELIGKTKLVLPRRRLIFIRTFRTKYSSKLLYHKIEYSKRRRKCKLLLDYLIIHSRKYMKESNIDIMHLNEINSVFLDCDEERKGVITKKSFILQIAE